jgi:hypothetical protein
MIHSAIACETAQHSNCSARAARNEELSHRQGTIQQTANILIGKIDGAVEIAMIRRQPRCGKVPHVSAILH